MSTNGKSGGIAEPEVDHPQDDLGQVRAQDLRRRELRPGFVILLRVQPDAEAFLDAAAAALPLVGARPGDIAHRQAVDARPRLVLGDAGEAGIDDEADAGDGQRGLGDVRGHDDLGPVDGIDAALLGGRKAGVEGEDRRPDVMLARELFAGLEDVLFGRHEDEDVPGAVAGLEPVHGLDGLLDVIRVLGPPGRGVVGLVLDLDREHAPADVDDGRAPERLAELFRVEGRRGDDELEVGAGVEERPGDPEQEIDVEAPLVGLVDDERVVFVEAGVGLRLGEEHAVGHDLDIGVMRGPVLEPDLVADRPAQGLAELLGDAVGDGDGGDAAGLGAADLADRAAPRLEAHLRDLGALAAAGLARDDDDLVVPDGPDDVLPPGDDGQLARIVQGGTARDPGLFFADGSLEPFFEAVQCLEGGLRVAGTGALVDERLELPAGEGPVPEHGLLEEAPHSSDRGPDVLPGDPLLLHARIVPDYRAWARGALP